MAFDPELADRVRGVLAGVDDVTEKKMFGGLTFMLGGKMCCGIVGDRLMVRVGPDAYDDTLAEPFVATMDFPGGHSRGWSTSMGKGFVRTILSLSGLDVGWSLPLPCRSEQDSPYRGMSARNASTTWWKPVGLSPGTRCPASGTTARRPFGRR